MDLFQIMKTTPYIGLLAGAALFLSGCATATVGGRIESNPEAFNRLPPEDQSLVRQGRISEGMTKEAVTLAWGRPDRVSERSEGGTLQEIWQYASYRPVTMSPVDYELAYQNYFYSPYWRRRGPYYCDPYYGYGYGFAAHTSFQPYLEGEVVFENGKVVSWERVR